MKNRGLSLLMVAGLLIFPGCFLMSGLLAVVDLQSYQTVQQFRYVGLLKNWNDAQAYCRERFSDLATIQNPANNTEARRAAGTSKFWIGLFNGTWKWSQDENELVPTSSSYSNWNTGEPQAWQCVLMSKTGYWFSKDCGELNEFLCYDAPLLRSVLVKQKMSWSDARSYCRSTYTDLSSIRSSAENALMTSLLPDSTSNLFTAIGSLLGGSTPSSAVAWIGLHRSDWVWSDGSISSYTGLGLQLSPVQANCVMVDGSGTWVSRPCSENYGFLCSTDVVPSMMRSVKIRLKTGSADLNDPEVQKSILQQLKQRMEEQGTTEEVKLRWRIQPDGKVFHQEDKRAPPGVCQTDTCDTI